MEYVPMPRCLYMAQGRGGGGGGGQYGPVYVCSVGLFDCYFSFKVHTYTLAPSKEHPYLNMDAYPWGPLPSYMAAIQAISNAARTLAEFYVYGPRGLAPL